MRCYKSDKIGLTSSCNYESVAQAYKIFRPKYPRGLFEEVICHVKNRNLAWDCGTGNGQVAFSLAKHFTKVIGTEKCDEQLKNVYQATNIEYFNGLAEYSNLCENSVDLITCAQAVHWFDLDSFYAEVLRVGNDNAIIAIWGYDRFYINNQIDSVLNEFFNQFLAPFRDDIPRRYLRSHYSTLPFEFEEIECSNFSINLFWELSDLIGYLSTMSSLREFILMNQHNPISNLVEKLANYWPKDRLLQTVFPIFIRIGRIHKS